MRENGNIFQYQLVLRNFFLENEKCYLRYCTVGWVKKTICGEVILPKNV